MKKLHIARESLFATIFTIVITFTVSFIPFKFEFSKGIRQEFLGFDIYDLYYSDRHLGNTTKDSNIVLIQIGDDRATIASQIRRIKVYSPAVIGVDAVFAKKADQQEYTMPAKEDSILKEAIGQPGNIVFASRLDIDTATGKALFIRNFFENGDHFPSGYINFVGNRYSVIRNYPPFYKTGDSINMAFTSAVIKQFSPGKYNILQQREKNLEVINYTRNLEHYITISKEQLPDYDSTGQLAELLHGKIVLLGYFVKKPPLVMDDIYFSPLNGQVAGKSYPDMYGVVIHANILSMVLAGNYASQAPEWVSYLLASVIIFFFLYYMLSQYSRKEHPSHGRFLLIQFLAIIIMLYVFLGIFSEFKVKVPLLPIMIALVLCVELLGLYKMIAVWLHKRKGFTTVFNHKQAV
ncbi:MAG: CHASE2 domain-containing protein [Chitinophagaceae bacterium]|nr:CHASE2 domain-containing protein [Chitinophagaceae bacterium]